MKNTRIWYGYRNQAGQPVGAVIVLSGLLSEEDKQTIANALHKGKHFIPAQVGMAPLSGNSEDETVWHNLDISMATPTYNRPDVDFTVEELVERFSSTIWNPALESARLYGADIRRKVDSGLGLPLRPVMKPGLRPDYQV